MSEKSLSDLAYGIVLVLTGGVAVASLIAAGFGVWSTGNPLLVSGLVLFGLFNAGLLGLLSLRHGKKGSAEGEVSGWFPVLFPFR
jgi:hypothetical protein